MAGAKPRHNRITGNLNILIGGYLWKKCCQVFGSDQRILTATGDGLYSYPDLSIICGPPRFTDLVKDTITNPTITVEVLSKSTEGRVLLVMAVCVLRFVRRCPNPLKGGIRQLILGRKTSKYLQFKPLKRVI